MGRIYIYIHKECRSVEAAPHHSLWDFLGECAVHLLNASFCFLWFTNCVLLYDE